MFLILVRRELLANLMTFRFLVAMVVTLSLVVANTVVLIADYERRLTSYDTAVKKHQERISRGARTYSEVETEIIVDRSPNPLSIFNADPPDFVPPKFSFQMLYPCILIC